MERPLADVGPVVLPESLLSTFASLGESESSMMRRAGVNARIALEQECEQFYWQTVRHQAFLVDLQTPEARAIDRGLDSIEDAAASEERATPDRRTEKMLNVLASIKNDIARRRISSTMASVLVREGITLRLLPDDVVATYSGHTRKILLDLLRNAPHEAALGIVGGRVFDASKTGYAHNIDVTPTEERDGIVLSSITPRHRVFLPQRWDEVTGLLPAVSSALLRENRQILQPDAPAALDAVTIRLARTMGDLRATWIQAPMHRNSPTLIQRLLQGAGLAEPPEEHTKSDLCKRAKEMFIKDASEWVRVFRDALDRAELSRFLR